MQSVAPFGTRLKWRAHLAPVRVATHTNPAMAPIQPGQRVYGPHGPLEENPREGKQRRARSIIYGNVSKSVGNNVWHVVWDSHPPGDYPANKLMVAADPNEGHVAVLDGPVAAAAGAGAGDGHAAGGGAGAGEGAGAGALGGEEASADGTSLPPMHC